MGLLPNVSKQLIAQRGKQLNSPFMQPWLSMFDVNTLNRWNSSSRTDKIVYISLATAVDSKFDWEKIGKGALKQLTAISMNKESSL